jgi:uncharacterized membrane protein YgaE (UPF0421/DUF939 family)
MCRVSVAHRRVSDTKKNIIQECSCFIDTHKTQKASKPYKNANQTLLETTNDLNMIYFSEQRHLVKSNDI